MANVAISFHPVHDARRTLAWALLASLLVHLLLILGTPRIEVESPSDTEAPLTVSARLALPPTPRPVDAPAPRTVKPRSRAARPSSLPAAPPAEPREETPAPEPVTEAPPAIEEETALPDIPFARRAPPPPPAAVTLPESADLEYVVFYGEGGFRAGRATHSWRLDGDRYTIRSAVEASGIVSLFYSGQMIHYSEGRLTAQGLRPDRYSLQRGTADRTETLAFDWDKLSAVQHYQGVNLQIGMVPGTQDQVSFLHQLPFVLAGESPFSLVIATPRKTEFYEVQVVGMETVRTDAGDIPALHVRRAAREDASSMDVWLARDLYYLPIKLKLRDNKGNLFEQVLATAKVR
jgi:Protein of unknown function (DUF3108)